MELVTATVKVLFLSTLLEQFEKDVPSVSLFRSDPRTVIAGFFRRNFGGGFGDGNLVRPTNVLGILLGADVHGELDILRNILKDLEEANPGVYIDVGS